MIAVCLLTCGREELSSRTVVSFRENNRGRQDLILLHPAAAGSDPHRSRVIAINGSFSTIHSPAERVPQMVSYRELIQEAALKGAEFVLWLENDWESVAPLPSLDFLRETRDDEELKIVTWRLFGVRRMRGRGDRGIVRTTQIGTDIPINWQPTKHAGWEFGRCHWGGGGCIATLDHLESQYHRKRLKDVVTAKPDLPTLRMVDNAMWHIGEESTPGLR